MAKFASSKKEKKKIGRSPKLTLTISSSRKIWHQLSDNNGVPPEKPVTLLTTNYIWGKESGWGQECAASDTTPRKVRTFRYNTEWKKVTLKLWHEAFQSFRRIKDGGERCGCNALAAERVSVSRRRGKTDCWSDTGGSVCFPREPGDWTTPLLLLDFALMMKESQVFNGISKTKTPER